KLMRAIPDSPAVAPATAWSVAGKPARKVNGRSFVTGEHKFASDVILDGMLHGKVLRAPEWGAGLASVDTKAAEAMTGVTVVRDGDFTGVAATGVDLASRALEAIRAEWKTTPQISSKDLFDAWRTAAKDLPKPENGIRQTYTVAYIAHVPLEPRA